ncbi:RNA 2',3'-cyclic phosphodiesterase [Rhodocista pekingensis]|uniref:RNA 2',3'-cyclic phosphodiesterase n=1 Tax=Rhodocista pekingensis TaxID=201185 RepID=A0ABW2KR24_9PROT
MIRLFVGLPLPEPSRDRLSRLGPGFPGARRVPPENFHLTLRFIGEVDEGTAQDIDAALDLVTAPPFPLMLEGLGQFGRGGRPRALWAGVARSEALAHLRDKVESAVVRAGQPAEERKFMPHVTLARLTAEAPAHKVGRFIAENGLFREGPLTVDRFVLFESVLGKGGSIYHELRSYPLGGWRPDDDDDDDEHDDAADAGG